MGHRGYTGNHPRFSKRADERYDAKEAYNKDLTASARLHYLENVRHDHDSPADMHCSPMRMHTDVFTLKELNKRSKKQDSLSKKQALKLPQREGLGNPDYESQDPQRFAGDDGYEIKKPELMHIKEMTKVQELNKKREPMRVKEMTKVQEPNKKLSPVRMEGKGCAKSEGGSGCVVKRGGEYVILNNKKGGIFQSGFKSKQAAERSLAGYHANK